jgi:transcription initiation factor TFIIIB Brf1 subunit/transcription initiation factor TFIIB
MHGKENVRVNVLLKRYNCHITFTNTKTEQSQFPQWKQNQQKLIAFKTDKKGFSQTRKSLSEKILSSLERLEVLSSEIKQESFRIMGQILFKLALNFRNKPH